MRGGGRERRQKDRNGNEPAIPSFGKAPPWREAGLGFTASLPRGEGRVQRELGLEWGKGGCGGSSNGSGGGDLWCEKTRQLREGILITSVSLGLGYTLLCAPRSLYKSPQMTRKNKPECGRG